LYLDYFAPFYIVYYFELTAVVLSENLQTAFVPFITAGDPDLATTAKALKILDACGSDVIELGVPYSDPLADGPVIQVGWYASTNLVCLVYVCSCLFLCFGLHHFRPLRHVR